MRHAGHMAGSRGQDWRAVEQHIGSARFEQPDNIGHAAAAEQTPEDYFHREWVRWMFTLAVEELRRRCYESGRGVHFQLFERYDLRDDQNVSYASLASEFDLPPATVNNYLAAVRREFRRVVLEKLREITATDEEFRTEARSLLGVDVK